MDFAFDIADDAFDADTEQSRQLRTLIDGLDEMCRALVLFHLEGFDHAQIADLLGATASTIGARLNGIKARLKGRAQE